MKKPRIAFNKDALLSFLVNHGEKVVVALFGIFACTLAWGGLEALRNLRPTEEQRPETITKQASESATHIEAVKIAPDDELTSEKGLAAVVERWRAPKVVPPPSQPLLDKPLFAELARRSSPTILPIEDLRAVTGVVVVAEKSALPAGRGAVERPLELDARNAPKPAKPPRGGAGGRGGPMPDPMAPPVDVGMMPPGSDPSQQQLRGKILPYVLVTGLIPVSKQQDEYNRRFGSASFRDMSLDTPRWNNYVIERTEVIPGTAESWKPIDLKAIKRRYSAEWSGLQAEPLLSPILQLAPEQERRDPTSTPLPFCSPLPQLIDGVWGFNAVHPWVADYVQKDTEQKRKAQEKALQENTSRDVFANQPGQPSGIMPDSMMPGMVPGMMPGMMPGMDGQMVAGAEYRLFRFIDTTVLPGHAYRYRVKLVCWNPNLNVPSRHLVDAAVAKQTTLDSAPSDATTTVIVPDGRRMLAQPLKKPELKRLKPGQITVSLLGEKPQGGAFALRNLIMEVGGLANVDPPQSSKKGDPRSRGDELVTDRVLLDVRGRLEDRTETRTGRPTPPPEPLEMLFLRPDGTFEFASAATSQPDLERYRFTLPGEGGPAAGGMPGQPPAGPTSPFGNPFSPQQPGVPPR